MPRQTQIAWKCSCDLQVYWISSEVTGRDASQPKTTSDHHLSSILYHGSHSWMHAKHQSHRGVGIPSKELKGCHPRNSGAPGEWLFHAEDAPCRTGTSRINLTLHQPSSQPPFYSQTTTSPFPSPSNPPRTCPILPYSLCVMATLAPPSPSQSPTRMPRKWARKCERYCCLGATYFPLVFVYSITSWAVWVEATIGFLPARTLWIGMLFFFLDLAEY